jgi:osmotically inducible protein OsmC
MAPAERRTEVVWRGICRRVREPSTWRVAVQDMPVTRASRTERPDGKTSPEEHIAAAHASCYVTAFSNVLAEMDNEPEELTISAVCTFDANQVKVTTMVLDVRRRVPGFDAEEFQKAAERGEQACPVSNSLRGNVDIQINASLV